MMIRVNTRSATMVRQGIHWNLDDHTIGHDVSYSNGTFHIYKKYETENFATACEIYEALEKLADEHERDILDGDPERHLLHHEHVLNCIEENLQRT